MPKRFSGGGGSATSRSTPTGKNQSPSPGIGKTGVTGDMKSNEGGQFPFLPPASSHSGRMGGTTKSGENAKTTETKIPFLPDKPE